MIETDPNTLLNRIGLPLQTAFRVGPATGYIVAKANPGELFDSLPEEQKAVLRRLKSADLDVRPDAIWPAGQHEWQESRKRWRREDGE